MFDPTYHHVIDIIKHKSNVKMRENRCLTTGKAKVIRTLDNRSIT